MDTLNQWYMILKECNKIRTAVCHFTFTHPHSEWKQTILKTELSEQNDQKLDFAEIYTQIYHKHTHTH